jgi:hypothetical protein
MIGISKSDAGANLLCFADEHQISFSLVDNTTPIQE